MATVTITISTPTLLTGQNFDVAHRILGSTPWIPDGLHTNAPFQIANLPDGNYEIRTVLVNSDGSRCPERIDVINVLTPSCPCITNVVGEVQQTSAYSYQIYITFTPPVTQPACGWTITFTDNSNNSFTSNYTTLTSPLIVPISMNSAYLVDIYSNCCGNQNKNLCANLDLAAAQISKCNPSVFPKIENQNLISYISGHYFMQLTCTQQSNPVTATFTVWYNQKNVFPGNQPDSQYVQVSPVVSGSNFLLTFPLNPNPNYSGGLEYEIQVQDICGNFMLVERL